MTNQDVQVREVTLFNILESLFYFSAIIIIIYNFISFILKKRKTSQYKSYYNQRKLSAKSKSPLPPINPEDIKTVCQTLKASYNTNALRDFETRKQVLYCFYQMFIDHKDEIAEAIHQDLHRDIVLSKLEVGSVIHEAKYLINNLEKVLKTKQLGTFTVQLFAKSYVVREPYGVVCVISPWNFPVNLSLIPAMGAIACGNTVFMKFSKYSEKTSKLLTELIDKYIPNEFIRCEYQSGREAIQACCDAPFDYYFFTGSTSVGRLIHKAAAEKFVPVTLELGGKNPVIVDRKCDIKIAARRIAFFKCVNAGQVCVACDHVFVPREFKDEFCKEFWKCIVNMYGENMKESKDFGRIITKQATKKLKELIEKSDVLYGGDVDVENKYVQPTVVHNVKMTDAIMEEEIFGPILPVIEYDTLEEVFENIKQHPNPLACYVCTNDDAMFERVVANVNSGSICNNDAVVHLLNSNLPFGGNCQSGVGYYHGKWSLETLSRPRTVCKAHTFIDLPFRYPPYDSFKDWVVNTLSYIEFPIINYL